MSGDKPKQTLECPHCKSVVPFGLVSRFANESRIAFRLVPAPGEFLQASTVGGSLAAMDKLYAATGRGLGIPTVTVVEGVEVDAEGGLTFKLLVLRYEGAKARKARMKQRAKEKGT